MRLMPSASSPFCFICLWVLILAHTSQVLARATSSRAFLTSSLHQHAAAADLHKPPASSSSSPLPVALMIPRGGAWYFGKKTAARKYKELLIEQVTMLDRQLRQSQEELALLRRQLKTSQSLLHRTASSGGGRVRLGFGGGRETAEQQADKLRALAENQDLKKRAESLTREVENLEKMKEDLQAIIETQHTKMEELELQLKAKGEENIRQQERAQQEMERLKQEIDAKYQKQIMELTNLMNTRIQEAAEHARQVAIREMEAKLAQVTAEERQRGEKLLAEERKRSEAAVEREKVKMRKLAKALFEREKKLNTLDKDFVDTTTASIKSSSPILPTSKTMNSSFKVDTIRKF